MCSLNSSYGVLKSCNIKIDSEILDHSSDCNLNKQLDDASDVFESVVKEDNVSDVQHNSNLDYLKCDSAGHSCIFRSNDVFKLNNNKPLKINTEPNKNILSKIPAEATKEELNYNVPLEYSGTEMKSNKEIKQITYSRKREASTSLEDDAKRRDHVRNCRKDHDCHSPEITQDTVYYCCCYSSDELEENNRYDNYQVSNINNNVVAGCVSRDASPEIPVYTNIDNIISSLLPQEQNILHPMDVDIQNEVSASDASSHSGSSVGIHEGLNCLHLTDEYANPANFQDVDNFTLSPPLIPSLFPNVPPIIYFCTEKERVQPLPTEIRKLLKWKLSTITPILIRQTVERSGFQLTKNNTDWIGTWGKHMKCVAFKSLKECQKVNHFPGSFHLGRKDKLWQNYTKLQTKHGAHVFSFFPETFILPQDIRHLRHIWECEGPKKRWIIKPPASARGTGIRVIHRWNQIPKKSPVIVQRYLSEPYLIHETKFDLRVYVLVPSFEPLRIYIFDDGLVRFASVKYSTSMRSLGDRFMHLTNYSINRKNSLYTANEDENVCQGHKWTLKSLWRYMAKQGIDTLKIWDDIVDVVIKTIICSEGAIGRLIRSYTKNRYNCYELFGFDIMLDKQLKPWLLEVNISPSLHTTSALDSNVKGQLAKDMFNIVGFQIPHNMLKNIFTEPMLCKYGVTLEDTQSFFMNKAMHHWLLSPEEKTKHSKYTWMSSPEYADILDNLTPDDVRNLVESEDELHRSGSFIRVFPSNTSTKYLTLFEHSRYYNILLDAWEQKYHRNRDEGILLLQKLCQKKIHCQTVYNSYLNASANKTAKAKK